MMCGELEAENSFSFKRTDIGNTPSSSGLWKPTRKMSEFLHHHEVRWASEQKPQKTGGRGSPRCLWGDSLLPIASGAAVPSTRLVRRPQAPAPQGLTPVSTTHSVQTYKGPIWISKVLSDFSSYIFETSFAQPSKCKMSQAITQKLENTDLPFQVKDKMVSSQVRR